MKAMIFAAGLGTRLKPLTNEIPKALVSVHGVPLLKRSLDYLEGFGVTEVIVNTHHFSDKIIDFCKSVSTNLTIRISDESQDLLDTGGGLKKAAEWLSDTFEPIVVINADIVTNLNLQDVIGEHNRKGNLATLAVRNRESSRKLIFNENYRLIGWKNLKTGEIKEVVKLPNKTDMYAFSGVHVISPEIFKLFPKTDKFSIIDFYLSIAAANLIGAYIDDKSYWFDIGSIEKLDKAEAYLKNMIDK